jgi:predicted RNA-binding protein with PUA-like domain
VEEEPVEEPRKRGRPAKAAAVAVEPSKKRGGPAKAAAAVEEETEFEEEPTEEPKKRGRPAKKSKAAAPKKSGRATKVVQADPESAVDEEDEVEDADNDAAEAELPKKRGRPGKKAATEDAPKKRGRPAKVATEPAEAPAAPDTPAPRKRHSGRTGGPTTKIATDATDAADQLEEELVDEVSKSAKSSDKRKASSISENEGGKNYWLFKAEQVDRVETLKNGSKFNTKFTIDDLKKGAPEPWEGVRNMVARNNMRAMKLGDLAFFYASQGKQPGITGIVEVVKEHEPDFTVTDTSSIGFVEPDKRSKENQWSLVHVEFRKKLSKPVPLKVLQKFSSGTGVLKDMQVMKQVRLSVSKVTEKEWNFIVDNLIEGYEDEDEGEGDEDEDAFDGVDESTPMPDFDGGDQATEGANIVDDEDLMDADGGDVNANLSADDEAMEDVELPADNSSLPAVLVDAELPTSNTELFAPSHPTSRQEVLNGSRPVSRAGSRAANSRQGSVAPLPVFQTTEETITSIAITQPAAEPARPASRGSRAGSLKPVSRPSSRAGSLQPAGRASSREPSSRPVSRGRDKTPNPAAMPSLEEHNTDG